MLLDPSQFDVWAIRQVAQLLGKHPLFDHGIESAVRHDVLGGLPFAVVLFVYWMKGIRSGDERLRRRVLTIFFGSLLAICLGLLASATISWLPPSRNPDLAYLYPQYLIPDINENSFPSQSTILCTEVAVGILSLDTVVGVVLLAGVLLLVSLPRMYLGGHYPTDIFVGFLIGFVGYLGASVLLERSASTRIDRIFQTHRAFSLLGEIVVFLWILQVAADFRDVVWIKNSLTYLFRLVAD